MTCLITTKLNANILSRIVAARGQLDLELWRAATSPHQTWFHDPNTALLVVLVADVLATDLPV